MGTTTSLLISDSLELIQNISKLSNKQQLLETLHQIKRSWCIEQAVFASYIREDLSMESFRFLAACNEAWCFEYQKLCSYSKDPWLIYASNNSEAVCGSRIKLNTPSQRETVSLAMQHGLLSSYIVPAPSSGGISRLGILVLGSSQPDFFESYIPSSIKILARSLAMELHDWWVKHMRQELLEQNHITNEDIKLLNLEMQGLSSKAIAASLATSATTIDSRFQRLNAKLNTPNRRASVLVAKEYGLI